MNYEMKTQVCIIGGGPAGMLLAHVLDLHGISSIVLERKSQAYVLARIRAGILESGTVEFLNEVGLGERLNSEGFKQDFVHFGFEGKETLAFDLIELTGKRMTGYGQAFITEDIYNASNEAGRQVIHNVEDVVLHDLESDPYVTFKTKGGDQRIDCEFICGCDGFHGVSRKSIPSGKRQEWERGFPFGWLGILAQVPPIDELFYANGPDGFVLASKRTPTLSRYYVQCPVEDSIDDWSDDRFWETILAGMPEDYRSKIVTGPSIEKSIAPLRSFVSEPMQYGKLFLAGDATHIVPPTGAKGLNLAVSDVYYLSRAFDQHYNQKKSELLGSYSKTALKRVWGAINLSWRLTDLLHKFPDEAPVKQKIRESEMDLLLMHEALRRAVAFEMAGLPL